MKLIRKHLTKEQAEKEMDQVLDKYEDDWNRVKTILTEDCDWKNARIKFLADELHDHFDAQMYRKIHAIVTRVKHEDKAL